MTDVPGMLTSNNVVGVQTLTKVRKRRERVEAESAIARQSADWDARLEETLAQVGQGQTPVYHSTDDFFTALDAVPVEGTEEKSDR